MTRGILFLFRGEGYGAMSGVTEYMTFHSTLHDEDVFTEEREPSPGFVLVSEERVVLPVWFPEEAVLIEKF